MSAMGTPSKPHSGSVCAINPYPGVTPFQSSQHLKRFIMFDHSNGESRIFFHPAAAQEIFGPACKAQYPGLATDMEINGDCHAFNLSLCKQMVEGAFSSLQSLRASRQSASTVREAVALTLPGTFISSQKPRVFESISLKSGHLDTSDTCQPYVASETLVCEEKAKVSAIPPSAESMPDCTYRTFQGCARSISGKVGGIKSSEVADSTEPMRESTDDLDALLSSDEDDDDDVQSTGRSPAEFLGKESGGDDNEIDNAKQNPSKRRRTFDEFNVPLNVKLLDVSNNMVNNAPSSNDNEYAHSIRKQKIKRTVKALRRMIPGGALLETAFVLDRTIMYVKDLQNRVNQLEATRLGLHP